MVSRTASLQSNTLFHLGAFMLPFDGGIMNQFTCYMVPDTEFTGENYLQFSTHTCRDGALVSGEDPAGGGGLQARILHGGALPRPGRVLSGKLGGGINIFYSNPLAGPC